MDTCTQWYDMLTICHTHSRMRCLAAIYVISRSGEEVSQKHIADIVGVSKPTIHRFVEVLRDDKLVSKDAYGKVIMTEKGIEKAEYQMKHVMAMSKVFRTRMNTSESESVTLAFECVEMMRHERLSQIESVCGSYCLEEANCLCEENVQ